MVSSHPCPKLPMLTDDEDEEREGTVRGREKNTEGEISHETDRVSERLPKLRPRKTKIHPPPSSKQDVCISTDSSRVVKRIVVIGTRTVVNHNYRDHCHDPYLYGQQQLDSRRGQEFNEEEAITSSDSLDSDRNDHNEEDQENEDEEIQMLPPRPGRGGVTVAFPERLHGMLSSVEEEGSDDVISWQPHGRCFLIHNKKRFVEEIMPRFFHQSKLTSFQRQLNLYGFTRLTIGEDRGGYYHEYFLRGRIDLCRLMIRTRVKGNGMKAASSPNTEPNFYTMEYCKEQNRSHGLSHPLPLQITCRKKKSDFHESTSLVSLNSCSHEEKDDEIIPDIPDAGPTTDEDMEGVLVSIPVVKSNPNLPIVSPLSSPCSLIDLVSRSAVDADIPLLPPADDRDFFAITRSKMISSSSSNLLKLRLMGYEDLASSECVPSMAECSDHFDISTSLANEYDINDDNPETGDEVYFEGLKFRYVDHLSVDEFVGILKSSSSLEQYANDLMSDDVLDDTDNIDFDRIVDDCTSELPTMQIAYV